MTDLRPPVTIRQVAALAGVSAAAVSRFVNRKQRFTPEVEARIAQAITAVGYRGNPAARSLATGRSGTVAALVAGVQNPHAAALVKGLCRVAMAEQYDVLFVDPLASGTPERELQRVMELQVDGIVIAAPLPARSGERLARYGRPFIDLTRRAAAGTAASPQAAAAALLARYLLHTGHRHIAWVGCSAEAAAAERLQGLRQTVEGAGLQLAVHEAVEPTADGGAAIASAVLLATRRPDAVVACNDPVAMGLLSEARALAISVPDAVSIAGIENMPHGRHLSPPLTSVDLHADLLGAQAMTRLLAAVRGEAEPVLAALPEPRLVVRGSTRVR